MEIQNLVIYVLAVWRIANLFVNERGPFDVFVRLRSLSGITMDDTGASVEIPDTFFAQVLSCVWCSSIWISFFWTIIWLVDPGFSLKFAMPFAFSGGAVLLEVWRQKKG